MDSLIGIFNTSGFIEFNKVDEVSIVCILFNSVVFQLSSRNRVIYLFGAYILANEVSPEIVSIDFADVIPDTVPF